jgi:hypothetical protein
MGTAKPSQSPNPASGLSRRTEQIVVISLCVFAALRVLVYCAAFPFFTNIDEQVHFDVVVKYSHGHLPRGLELVSPESAQYIGFFGTLEYFKKPTDFPENQYQFPSPPWLRDPADAMPDILGEKLWWEERRNFESSQPPLYYSLAAAWWHVGKMFGLTAGNSLYWIRTLNAVIAALLVYLGFVVAGRCFPDESWTRICVPIVLAFIPQDAFYSIENDVLSPITFGLTFLCLLRLIQNDSPSLRLWATTGLMIAATYLTKISNLPLVAMALLVGLAKLWSSFRHQRTAAPIKALLIFVTCAAIPIIAWMVRTKFFYGDITGSNEKIQLLDWTRKPIGDWFNHPIFTPTGFWVFISELIPAFWHGEFLWHKETIASPGMNLFYTLSSVALLTIALWKRKDETSDRKTLWLCFLSVISAIAFLGFLSIQFDYGRCVNPSRAHPYFISGRLMTGVLIPFSILYVYGLAKLLRPIRRPWLVTVLIAILMLIITLSEVSLNTPAFKSQYNWYHLKGQ